MTSVTKTNNLRRGFTLIEIVMVLAIVGIVSGGAMAFLIFSSDERDLRKTSSEIESLARRARTTAMLQQTPYALEFTPGSIRLMPWVQTAQAGRSSPFPSLGQSASKDETVSQHTPVFESFSPTSDLSILVKRWNSGKWEPMKEKNPQVWRFDPDGLCEPITVRMEFGKSWIEDTYHPLNAAISDSQFEIK